jgi:hypothetical protein
MCAWVRRPFPSETGHRSHILSIEINAIFVTFMEAVEATQCTFFYSNKHNLCHKEILNPRVRPTRQRGLREHLCAGRARPILAKPAPPVFSEPNRRTAPCCNLFTIQDVGLTCVLKGKYLCGGSRFLVSPTGERQTHRDVFT